MGCIISLKGELKGSFLRGTNLVCRSYRVKGKFLGVQIWLINATELRRNFRGTNLVCRCFWVKGKFYRGTNLACCCYVIKGVLPPSGLYGWWGEVPALPSPVESSWREAPLSALLPRWPQAPQPRVCRIPPCFYSIVLLIHLFVLCIYLPCHRNQH